MTWTKRMLDHVIDRMGLGTDLSTEEWERLTTLHDYLVYREWRNRSV